MRQQRTITVWDKCECGRLLLSISEGVRGMCSSCWVKSMPADTKTAMNKMISAAFSKRPLSDSEKDDLVKDAVSKLSRDAGSQP